MERNKEQQLCAGIVSDFDESLVNDSNSYAMANKHGISEISLFDNIGNDNLQVNDESVNSISITHLPEVALVSIMKYLSLKDRYYLSMTCRLFYDLFSHPQLWQVAHISLLTQGNGHNEGYLTWKLKSVMHKTMVEIVCRFSHLFQHLSLEMFRHVQPFDDNCRRMLEDLNKDCRLESLSIRLGALASVDKDVQRNSVRNNNFNDLPLVVSLIKNAVRLKRLSIISWPLHVKAEEENEIFQALLRNEKIKSLETLSLFYVEPKSESWTERNPKLPSVDTTFELVSHFRNLTHLAVRSPMLNDAIINELASKKRTRLCLFQILIVYSVDSAFQEGYKVPDISSKTWKNLKVSSPQLKVEYLVITRIPQIQLSLMLKPEIPLSSVTILNYGKCDEELVENIVEKYKGSLEKFISLCDSASCDQALVNLVEKCSELKHIVFHGNIHHKTVVRMAEIINRKGIKLSCFEFKEENIQTNSASDCGISEDVVVARDAEDEYYLVSVRSWHEDENERKRVLNHMVERVSHALGYRWQPVV